MSKSQFSCKNVDEKDIKDIVEKIKRNPEIIVEIKDIKEEYKTVYVLRLKLEKLTVNFFCKSRTAIVQGNANSLFSLFLSLNPYLHRGSANWLHYNVFLNNNLYK